MERLTKNSANNHGEAAGLRWLAEAMPQGGARVATVLAVTDTSLDLEYIDTVTPTAEHARNFGRALAVTHAAGAPWWGSVPGGWVGPNNIGQSKTILVTDKNDAPHNFGEFYGELRIRDFTRRLVDNSVIDAHESRVFDKLADRISAGHYTSEQPELVRKRGHRVARLHGDMWAGNVLYDGGATGATLIDPMAHGGHAETDLAALSVFGFPYLEQVCEGYDEVSPLADGWQERNELHQLGMVIMHAHLFRGHYIQWALEIAKNYV